MKKLNYKILGASCLAVSCIMFNTSQSQAFVGEIFTIGDLDYTVRTENGATGTVSVGSTDSGIIGDITIPSFVKNNGITYSVVSIEDDGFKSCGNLTGVIIPSSVTSLGRQSFGFCRKLTSITIPDTVTSIEERAFIQCDALMDIVIPDSVISIGNQAFDYCDRLSDITIPDSVIFMGDNVFNGCKKLVSVILSNSLSSIGSYAFQDCERLISVTIPDSVTSIGHGAFMSCVNLRSITIGNGVTSIGSYAFQDCKSLTSIIIPDNVTSIGDYTFYGCTILTNATIGKGLISIGMYAFFSMGLTEIFVNEENSAYCSMGGVLFNKDRTSLIQYPTGKNEKSYVVPDGVTSIEQAAFESCKLKSVSIPASVAFIGKYAFQWCKSLTSVYYQGDVPYAERTSYTYEGIYEHSPDVLTSYYPEGNATWEDAIDANGQWYERNTAVWNPPPQTNTKISYNYQNGIITLTFTGTLQESNDLLNWTPILNVQDSYNVDTTKGKKFYRSVK